MDRALSFVGVTTVLISGTARGSNELEFRQLVSLCREEHQNQGEQISRVFALPDDPGGTRLANRMRGSQIEWIAFEFDCQMFSRGAEGANFADREPDGERNRSFVD